MSDGGDDGDDAKDPVDTLLAVANYTTRLAVGNFVLAFPCLLSIL
jgi:hypothetical protein